VTFRFKLMNQEDAEMIALWHYPEPFSFYDWAADGDDLAELLDPEARKDFYASVEDEACVLVGYFTFKPKAPGILEIGLGLHPEKIGRGHGGAFLTAGLEYARRRFAPEEFTLAVASFNRRAITVYERAGFAPVRVYMHSTNGGEWEFVEMRRPA
jgi:[ribosomal protein S18]-alanine N-acetyltransferase